MTGTTYYYADYSNTPVGPYSADELRQLQLSGQITTSSLVAEAGGQTWQTYGSLLALNAPHRGVPSMPPTLPPALYSPVNVKDKTTAGLLAIFLGGLGIHKFYLGFNGPALVFLLTNTIGWLITWIVFGLPNIALGIIALIEGITYLTKSDQEFYQTYVVGKKQWF